MTGAAVEPAPILAPGSTRAVAAVTLEAGTQFALTEVTLPPLRPDEILVRMRAVGICRSDLHVAVHNPFAPYPILVGHEGAGEIAAVGSAVTGCSVGDRVGLSFTSCGGCDPCLEGRPAYCTTFTQRNVTFWFREDGSPTVVCADGPISAGFFGQSSLATYAITGSRNIVPLPDDLPFELAAPLGCGVQTGAGAALRTLNVRPGQSVVVIGAGGVGLSAVMAAALVSADPLIVVEPNPERWALALELGATHAIDTDGDTLARVADVAGPVDFVIDTTGVPAVLADAVRMLGTEGTLALIGVAPQGTELKVELHQLSVGRKVRGLVEGDAVPQTFLPMLIRQWRRGRFPLERIVRTYPFTDIGRAVEDMTAGRTIKPVLVFASAEDERE